jgi:hypothetical protein
VLELFCDGQRHLSDAVPSFRGCGKNLIDGQDEAVMSLVSQFDEERVDHAERLVTVVDGSTRSGVCKCNISSFF